MKARCTEVAKLRAFPKFLAPYNSLFLTRLINYFSLDSFVLAAVALGEVSRWALYTTRGQFHEALLLEQLLQELHRGTYREHCSTKFGRRPSPSISVNLGKAFDCPSLCWSSHRGLDFVPYASQN